MTQARAAGAASGPKDPFVTVVVLNYNGGRLVTQCLRSLLATDYPAGAVEFVVVDNASADGSPDAIARDFPSVRLIRAGANLGFAAGNNLALRQAPGPYVALVNPDTEVDPAWLRPLVKTLQADPAAGIAQAKLLLYRDRIPVKLDSEVFVPRTAGMGVDERSLGLRVYDVAAWAGGERLEIEYRSGFGGREPDATGRFFRWTLGPAELGVVAGGSGPIRVSADLAGPRPFGGGVGFTITVGGEVRALGRAPAAAESVEFELPAETRRHAAPVVQNAGSRPLPDGSSRDRGTIVENGNVYCDWDGAAYADEREVFSFCGAGALLRKTMLEEAGYFDERFFMYYEDTDLAIRARRRAWRVLFQPQSVIRHHHAALAREWSPFFNYHVARSRLCAILKNWPLEVGLRAVAQHLLETARSGLRSLKRLVAGGPGFQEEWNRFLPMARALGWLAANTGGVLAARKAEAQAGLLDFQLFRPWLAER